MMIFKLFCLLTKISVDRAGCRSVESKAGYALYFYISGFAEYGDAGNDRGVAEAEIFERGTLLYVDTVKSDGECR